MVLSVAQPARRRAFTLIELLIVIGIIGILVTLVVTGTRVISNQQRVALTKTLQQNLLSIIDDFAAADPLRSTYKDSFGPYPPYELDVPGGANSTFVGEYVEPERKPSGEQNRPDDALERLRRDFFNIALGDSLSNEDERLVVPEVGDPLGDRYSANRALAAYLGVYTGDRLSAFPPAQRKPLPITTPSSEIRDFGEYINTGDRREVDVRVPILGFHDAWGVPFGYLLYVKVELQPSGADNVWRVTDRQPVLLSRGVEQKVIDAGPAPLDKWIWSSELPAPLANVDQNGNLPNPVSAQPKDGGWLRLVPFTGATPEIGYLPEFDGAAP